MGRTDEDGSTITVKIPLDLKTELIQRAALEERSLTMVVRRAIRFYLRKVRPGQASPSSSEAVRYRKKPFKRGTS